MSSSFGKYLTGRTRFRALPIQETVILVLQVEYGTTGGPFTGWRDAGIEDLRGKEVEVRT